MNVLAGVAMATSVFGCGVDTASTTGADDPVAGPADVMIVGSPGSDFEVEGAYDLGRERPRYPLSVTFYGDPDAAAPFTDGDLAILTSSEPAAIGAEEHYDDERDRTEIRGGKEAFTESTGVMAAVGWTERTGFGIVLTSSSLPVDDLTAIAEGLAVDDAGHVTVGELPGGLKEVRATAGEQVLSEGWGIWLPSDVDATGVRYHDDGGDGASVDVVTIEGPDEGAATDLLTAFRFWHPELSEVELRGVDVLLDDPDDSDDPAMAVWAETSTTVVLVSIEALEVDPSELIEGLRPATRAETEDLLATGERRVADEEEAETAFAEGTTEAGRPWELTASSDGSVCLDVFDDEEKGGFSGSCATVHTEDEEDDGVAGPDIVHEPRSPDEDESADLVFGAVPDGVDEVEVAVEAGEPVVATFHRDDDVTAYLAEIPAGVEPTDVVFRDGSGEEISREAVG
jgi:hypothetical protein